MSIRLSEEKHKYLTGVYTWVRPDRYVGLESSIENKFCLILDLIDSQCKVQSSGEVYSDRYTLKMI